METAIVLGFSRLPCEKELALNEMLHRYGGEYGGMPQYKLGWAQEDNRSYWNESEQRWQFDKVPVCAHECQQSYHLLSWEAPSAALLAYEDALKEDLSRGTYACLCHFVHEGKPFDPTVHLIEGIIPMLVEFSQSAQAARRGLDAVVHQRKEEKIEREHERQRQEERDYESYADALLSDQMPAFGGAPFSAPTPKSRQTADLTTVDLKAGSERSFEPELGQSFLQFRVVPRGRRSSL